MTMHRIVSFASPPVQGSVDLLSARSSAFAGLPADLKDWVQMQVPAPVGLPVAGADADGRATGGRDAGAADPGAADPALTWTPPHERALAQALGLPAGDGQVPIGGLLAARAGLPRDGRVWARVSPVHWHLGTEQVTMRDPSELALVESEARALFESARPWFEEEGYALHWVQPSLWLAAHPGLAGLRTASLDRVSGRNVDLWLGADPQARRLRRLQSEVQMLWHIHPVNAQREADGRETVNSFWIDGCGPVPDAPVLERAGSVVLDEHLRGPALRGDLEAWQAALRQVVQDVVAEAATEAVTGHPNPSSLTHRADGSAATYRVTWCGDRHALTMAPPPPETSLARLWRELRQTRQPRGARRPWPACLETL